MWGSLVAVLMNNREPVDGGQYKIEYNEGSVMVGDFERSF